MVKGAKRHSSDNEDITRSLLEAAKSKMNMSIGSCNSSSNNAGAERSGHKSQDKLAVNRSKDADKKSVSSFSQMLKAANLTTKKDILAKGLASTSFFKSKFKNANAASMDETLDFKTSVSASKTKNLSVASINGHIASSDEDENEQHKYATSIFKTANDINESSSNSNLNSRCEEKNKNKVPSRRDSLCKNDSSSDSDAANAKSAISNRSQVSSSSDSDSDDKVDVKIGILKPKKHVKKEVETSSDSEEDKNKLITSVFNNKSRLVAKLNRSKEHISDSESSNSGKSVFNGSFQKKHIPVKQETCKSQLLEKYKSDNDLKVIHSKLKSVLDDIDSDNEIYVVQLPKSMHPSLLMNQFISLHEDTKIAGEDTNYVFNVEQSPQNPVILMSNTENNECRIKSLQPSGMIKMHRVLKSKHKVRAPREPYNFKVPFPDNLKVRHPIFGADYKEKIVLDEQVQQKLDNTLMSFNRKLKKKKKRRHSETVIEDSKKVEAVFKMFDENKKRKDKSRDDQSEIDYLLKDVINSDNVTHRKKKRHNSPESYNNTLESKEESPVKGSSKKNYNMGKDRSNDDESAIECLLKDVMNAGDATQRKKKKKSSQESYNNIPENTEKSPLNEFSKKNCNMSNDDESAIDYLLKDVMNADDATHPKKKKKKKNKRKSQENYNTYPESEEKSPDKEPSKNKYAKNSANCSMTSFCSSDEFEEKPHKKSKKMKERENVDDTIISLIMNESKQFEGPTSKKKKHKHKHLNSIANSTMVNACSPNFNNELSQINLDETVHKKKKKNKKEENFNLTDQILEEIKNDLSGKKRMKRNSEGDGKNTKGNFEKIKKRRKSAVE